ncbi:AAA family ATPase [Herbiconiux sp. CPCC 205716]|uniref:AAA family ATPase n=1 Tax=Herbiconiux gentiana TaxID=2970912 RepID=A0ABT2GBD8_9MICO|nr:AAA family ATPase [Herbiconiux gentiana]MCS5713519.1 AAA family ATPase [Herbiconiux gentiana]
MEELTFSHNAHGTLPLSYLSSGIKIAAGLVIDLVSRIARANPGIGAHDLLQAAPGVVLIDEIDLHLHPLWQQRILPQLRKTFPRVQFIVTTHSPQVLSTVEAESIRIVDGNVVRLVDYSAGLRSDVIMDRILGTRPEPNLEVNEQLDRYVSLVNAGNGLTPEAHRLRELLDDELGGIANVPKLADADAEISFYDLDD